MKIRLHPYTVIISTLVLVASARPVCAQVSKGIKYVPKAVKEVKAIPSVVNPKLPHTVQVKIATPVMVRASVASAQPVTVKVVTPSLATPLSVTAALERAVIVKTAAQQTDLVEGIKSVSAYYPSWRQELSKKFSNEQLDALENAFAAADQAIFVRKENGVLTVRNPNEWDYETRFLRILEESGVNFTDLQIKQITGGSGIKGFTFIGYITLKNVMAFTLAKGNYPRKDIWDGGERLSMYELQERAKTGDIQSVELVRELEIGKRISNAPLRWSDEPIYQDLKSFLSNDQYLNQAKPKTPQEWLAVIEPWVIEHGRFPSDVIKEETQMYHGAFWAIRYNPQNPASIRLKELQKKYTSSTEKTPQEWLAVIEPWVTQQGRWPSNITAEEKKMYQGAYHAMNLRANDPASMRLKELKEKYQGKPATPKTQPAEDLLDVDDKDAVDAVTLAEKYLDNPEVGTDEYIDNLLRFYDKLDPFVTRK